MRSAGRRLAPSLGLVLIALVIAPCGSTAEPGAPVGDEPASRWRRPVALAVGGGGTTLLVANGRSGTITEIDLASEKRIAEYEVARSLSDLVPLPVGSRFAAIDPEAGDLLLLEHHPKSLTVKSRLAVGLDPIRVAILPDGTACVVTSRWGRRLMIVDITLEDGAAVLRLRRSIDLPFPAREVVLLRGGKALLVADAFGGKLAVVDSTAGTMASVREIPGHNLRGLSLSRDGSNVILARQLSSRLATSSFDDVHWGALMKNQVITLRTDVLLDPGMDPLGGLSAQDLDEVGHAAGDPEDLAVDSMGRIIVALAGVGEIAILGNRCFVDHSHTGGDAPVLGCTRLRWPTGVRRRC